jgi:hypothetical protein
VQLTARSSNKIQQHRWTRMIKFLANRRRSVFLSHTIAAQTKPSVPEGSSSVLLILLLILDDLRLFQALMNAEDNFKSSSPVENKRHTNAHQPSPPSQQQRLQSPLSARFLPALELGESACRFRRVIARLVYPSVIPTAENFSRLGVSRPEGHQRTVAANLIDLPELPESRRDRFGSSAELCFIGTTV